MAKVYNGGFTASTGFKRTSNSPLVDTDIYEFLTDLPLVEKPYKLMVVSILETLTDYQWNGLDITNLSNWIPIGKFQPIPESIELSITSGTPNTATLENPPSELANYVNRPLKEVFYKISDMTQNIQLDIEYVEGGEYHLEINNESGVAKTIAFPHTPKKTVIIEGSYGNQILSSTSALNLIGQTGLSIIHFISIRCFNDVFYLVGNSVKI